jgi:hypothetical protein
MGVGRPAVIIVRHCVWLFQLHDSKLFSSCIFSDNVYVAGSLLVSNVSGELDNECILSYFHCNSSATIQIVLTY